MRTTEWEIDRLYVTRFGGCKPYWFVWRGVENDARTKLRYEYLWRNLSVHSTQGYETREGVFENVEEAERAIADARGT